MLSSGALAVPKTACVRCHLRGIIVRLEHQRLNRTQRLRPYPATCRTFSATTHARQDSLPEIRSGRNGDNNDRKYYYRHINPNGRIVGKGPRKQRQVSEKLGINTLGEEAEIVVFRDVAQDPKAKKAQQPVALEPDESNQDANGALLTPEQIEAEAMHKTLQPGEEEINASIETLRPSSTLLDRHDFDDLLRQLTTSYNQPQLSRYLSRIVKLHRLRETVTTEIEVPQGHNSNKIFRRVARFERSKWQPGTTPIEERRMAIFQDKRGISLARGAKVKARTAENIMRLGWEVLVHSEEQQVGELEISARPGKIELLFNTEHHGRPTYEAFVESPLLLRRSDVRPYLLDNIIRITARRQDAEEIAQRLQAALLQVGKLNMDLKPFDCMLGKPDWPNNLNELFNVEDLKDIGMRTRCVILPSTDGIIEIYGIYPHNRHDARRLLLSLLPTEGVRTKVLEAYHHPNDDTPKNLGKLEDSTSLVPVFGDSKLHWRDRNSQLGRLVSPSTKENERCLETDLSLNLDAEMRNRIDLIAKKVSKFNWSITPPAIHESSYWKNARQFEQKNWQIEVGTILRDASVGPEANGKQDARHANVFLRDAPGWDVLLSYLQPQRQRLETRKRFDSSTDDIDNPTDISRAFRRPSLIVAHFMPSPFRENGAAALLKHPQIQLTYDFVNTSSDPRAKSRSLPSVDIRLSGVRAIFAEHVVEVPLPGHAVDIRLARKEYLSADVSRAQDDEDIRAFTAAFRKSFHSGRTLYGSSQLRMRLPLWKGWADEPTEQDMKRELAGKGRPEKQPAEDMEVDYLFQRFEHVQFTNYHRDRKLQKTDGVDREAREVLHNLMRDDFYVRTADVNAGAVGGNRTEVLIRGRLGVLDNFLKTDRKAKTGEAVIDQTSQGVDAQAANLEAENTEELSQQAKSTEDVTEKQSAEQQAPETQHPTSSDDSGLTKEDIGPMVEDAPSQAAARQQYLRRLMKIGLGVANLLTRASSGRLQRYNKRTPQQHQAQDDGDDGEGDLQQQTRDGGEDSKENQHRLNDE